MFKAALLASVFLGLSNGKPETLKKIKNHINKWNWDVQCWGENNVVKHRMMLKNVCEQCMQMPTNEMPKSAPLKKMLHATPMQAAHIPSNFLNVPASTYSLGYPYANAYHLNSPYIAHHGKRSAGMSNNLEEFLENAEVFKEGCESKISNLTCILKTMGAIDSDFKINRAMFETEIWKMKDLSATDNVADPVWRQKMSGMWTDCIDAAESLPQSLLDNNPISRMMGPLARFNCFMKCKKVCSSTIYRFKCNQSIFRNAHT